MTQQPLSRTEGTKQVKETVSQDCNLEADDWDTKRIGFLAQTVLSTLIARKRTEEANAVASSVSYAQAVWEVGTTASNTEMDRQPDLTSQR
ncbi:hypothetical protein OSJ77_19880 [Phyllobacterium sp. 0TCS1.6C]|uniref:hypothetical protein n=1 Tax=unclassified Phyllobacterium TaxID=2638441 RepID=UPI0022645B82|nr:MULTISPECIES: hypothetical protein [unclassified Phyllobacterium]MCX8282454.1 hypothetical protein [Phyllobacterium sp. 0TCS1.6C]MCX8292546.1 hypothetical protein [Phyllobacterium sp. 0TCS1.6A]